MHGGPRLGALNSAGQVCRDVIDGRADLDAGQGLGRSAPQVSPSGIGANDLDLLGEVAGVDRPACRREIRAPAGAPPVWESASHASLRGHDRDGVASDAVTACLYLTAQRPQCHVAFQRELLGAHVR